MLIASSDLRPQNVVVMVSQYYNVVFHYHTHLLRLMSSIRHL